MVYSLAFPILASKKGDKSRWLNYNVDLFVLEFMYLKLFYKHFQFEKKLNIHKS
jgi:hypothetical protein